MALRMDYFHPPKSNSDFTVILSPPSRPTYGKFDFQPRTSIGLEPEPHPPLGHRYGFLQLGCWLLPIEDAKNRHFSSGLQFHWLWNLDHSIFCIRGFLTIDFNSLTVEIFPKRNSKPRRPWQRFLVLTKRPVKFGFKSFGNKKVIFHVFRGLLWVLNYLRK